MKEGDLERLQKIAEFEDTHDMSELKMGWRYRHVGIQGSILSNLFLKGYLEEVFRSRSYTGYRLSELGRAVIAGAKEKAPETPQDAKIALPDDLFEDIIGHDDVKELLGACLTAEKPVHVLLAGPPALAKTLFLWDIEKALGERAIWLVGSATSKAGLWDLVAERQPFVLEVDELDKMNAADTAALLSMMEGGRLVRAKVGRELNLQHEIRVVAATNRLYGLSPELLSRFAVRKIQAYSRSDFLTVVKGVLVRREGVEDSTAEEIAKRLDGRTQDVRDAIRVARLAPQLGVEKAIKLLEIKT
ncbi:MAG: AAA family ATPase [Chloroflexota bacterium]